MAKNGWRRLRLAALCALVAAGTASCWQARSADEAPSMVPIQISSRPPAGAVVLFAGKEDQFRSNFVQRGTQDPSGWEISAEGVATPNKKDATSKQEFGDCYLHAEFWEPTEGGGNSGLGLQGRYEVQILNSYGKAPESHECGSFYDQKAPRVIASKPAGQWQAYDVIFRAPRLNDDGSVKEQARATVFLNGVLVQNNEAFNGPTGIQYGDFKGTPKTGPLVLQGDHDPVKFRNIWVLPM